MRTIILATLLTACGSTQTSQMSSENGAPPAPLHAEAMRGPAAGPAGRVLVITTFCGSLMDECRDTWAPTVDQIVTGALEFRGYATIDPETLRKDERQREERVEEASSRHENTTSDRAGGAGFIGLIPIGGAGAADHHELTVSKSRHKTIILQGANFDDLRIEDKQALMRLAGAQTVATIRVVVGANYGTWTMAQTVEVVVKLAAAETGDMRWSTRCMASSVDYPNVEAAIENAARCATSAFALNQ